jgi:hypothetical protein
MQPRRNSGRGKNLTPKECRNKEGNYWDKGRMHKNGNNLNREPVILGDGAAYVPLTNRYIAIIDAEDAERVSRYKWYARKCRKGLIYAATHNPDGDTIKIQMHRFILNNTKDKYTDHKNGNTLDNRKCNLRPCTKGQNNRNRRPKPHSSIYKGVCLRGGKWKARTGIGLVKKEKNIGTFDSEIEAARAYDAYVKKIDPEFAYLNFPED